MRYFSLLFAFALCALTQNAFAQPNKQIIVEAVPGATDTGGLRMVPPLGHTEAIYAAALSPRGDLMLTGSGDQTAKLWDVNTGREVKTLPVKGSYALAVAWTPDGKRALVGGNNYGILYLWDAATGRILREMDHPNDVISIAVSADGKRALTGSGDNLVRAWNLETGALIRQMDDDPTPSRDKDATREPRFVAWNGDGKKSVALTQDKRLMQHDVATGKLLDSRDLDFVPVGLSRDARFALGSDEDALIIWDVNAARATARFEMPHAQWQAASAAALSPDGKLVAAGSNGGEVRVWDVATSRLVATWTAHNERVMSLSWSEDGQFLTSAGFNKVTRLWKTAALGNAQTREVRAFRGYSLPIERLLISPDGRSMLARTNEFNFSNGDGTNTLQLSDIATGRRLARWQVPGLPRALAWSRDSRRVLVSTSTLGAEPGLFLFDVGANAPLREYKGFSEEISSLAWSADGSRFLSGGYISVVRLWNADSSAPVAQFKGAQSTVDNLSWSADQKRFTALEKSGLARVWDVATQNQLKQWRFAEPDERGQTNAEKTAFTPDGRWLFSGAETDKQKAPDGSLDWRNILKLFDVEQGSLVRVVGKANHFANSITLSDDARWAVTADVNEGLTQLWDLGAGREANNFRDKINSVVSLAMAPDGTHIFTVSRNGSVAIRDRASGAIQLTYLPMENGDWLAFTPEGLFDGSPNGIERVTFEKGGQTFALAQFAERFYRPGLVAQIMGAENVPAPTTNAATILANGAPPLVKITSPRAGAADKETIEVIVSATAQNGGGVKAIRLYQNGRLVGGPGELRGIVVEAALQTTGADTKTQKFTVTLAAGANVLRAVAYSQTDLESLPDEVRLTFAAANKKPALHVVAIGINQYKDATMNLTYARPDAESLVQFFKQPQNTTLFSDTTVVSLLDEAATGEAIKKSLADLSAQSRPEDVVFIYLAGHGETAASDEKGDDDAGAAQNFYFLPYEMRQMVMKNRVRQFGVSGAEINGLIDKIAARKIVLVYDACKSGAAIEGATRGAGDEQQALAKLARAQGIYVLTASTGQQYAGEVKALGHGILTYALLEGLGGKAAGGDSLVKVSGLFAYADDRVPALAKEFRGREQWPVSFGKGQNFPLVLNGATP